MSHRPAPFGRLAAILGALALGIAACSSTAAPGSPASAGTSPAAPSPTASTAVSSQAAPSGVVPSFTSDLDLESRIPNEFCGQKVVKYSFAGSDFLANDAKFAAVVGQLGRSPADVSVATAGVAGPECLGINLIALRIKGADQGRFEQLFLASQASQNGAQPTKSNIGGKDVWVYTDTSGTTNYIYFKGDTAYGVAAKTQADAARGLAVMP